MLQPDGSQPAGHAGLLLTGQLAGRPESYQQPHHRSRWRGWGLAATVLIGLLVVGLVWLLIGSGSHGLRAAPQPPRSIAANAAAGPIPTYLTPVTAEMSTGVVLISGRLADGRSSGTGIIVADSGLVLTNYHVVANTTGLQVQLATNEAATYPAELLGRNAWADIAVLQLAGAKDMATAQLSDDPVEVGDRVIAVGNADGRGALIGSGGSVLNLDATVNLPSTFGGYGADELNGMIRSSAGAVPGYSGGPTFNAHNQVVGLTSAGHDHISTEMITYSIPIRAATNIADDIIAGHQDDQTRIGPGAWLGVTFGSENIPVITQVTWGSPAARAGLSVGSRITRFAGQPITTANAFLKALESYDPGEQVEITWVEPRGQSREASVVLGTSSTN